MHLRGSITTPRQILDMMEDLVTQRNKANLTISDLTAENISLAEEAKRTQASVNVVQDM
jgi:hypothetical protein